MVKLMFLAWLLFGKPDSSPGSPTDSPQVPAPEASSEKKREKGQGLVEFALVIVVLMLGALGGIDIAFKSQNQSMAQDVAFQAARQASIYLNGGGYSCDSWVRSHISQPVWIGVAPEDWTLTLTGCPDDASWSQVSGTQVSATVTWHQHTVWWSESSWIGQRLAYGTVTMYDVYQ